MGPNDAELRAFELMDVDRFINPYEADHEVELRFALAFWSLRFSKLDCVLSQDFLRFVSRLHAFCLKTSCVLSQDFLCFVSRLLAFCLLLKTFSAGQQNRGQGTNPQGGGAAGYGGVQNRVGNANPGQARQDLALNVDNVFQADDCDAFDSGVDEAPTAQTMFMAHLSSADPVYDEAGPLYDSNILSKVHDHDNYQDVVCEHHEEYAMHDNVQLNHVVDSHADYTSDSNMILYDQYVKDNPAPGVHNNVSSVPNDAYMMIYNDMHEPHAQYVSKTSQNTLVKNSLTAKLATYKEQVELYERRAMFELTKREQNINEQLRIVITDRNFKEETLKKELHSVKLQLASTINHNKLMARCLELEAELSTLRDKSHNDNHNELVNRFSNLEDHVKPTVPALGKYAIDVEPLPPRFRNNREVHLDYPRHLKESVETIREIVKEAKVVRPLDSSIVSAFRYTEHSQELLEYAIGTCPQDSHPRDKKHVPAPLIKKK
uniref:Integrase, catalytic region, zinc finger, CCHC-type, peptidase aspartic, catalytic n=1 Tax=Tanacetum cinerariifolium TaxID=118510 RepID=A0A6L2NMN5_TANCI|nr:hypothetical protein [Tanacetum cinerariifolium]